MLKLKEMFSTAGATAIVVVVVLLVVWGAITIVPKAISSIYSALTASLSSTFVASKALTVTADKENVESGSTVDISINGEDTNGALYTLYYPCTDGLTVLLNGASGTSSASINCGEDFYLLNKNGSFAITMNSNKTRFLTVPLTVKSQDSKGELQKIGSVNVGVINQSIGLTKNANENTVTPVNTVNPTPVYVAPAYYGNSDLSVNIINVDNSNLYNMSATDQVLVKFEIKNIGTNQTGQWAFSATLPSASQPSYTSDLQRNLNPGDKIQYTLGFGNVNTTNSSLIKITADPANAITESNESNNSATYNLVYNNSTSQVINTNPGNNNYYYTNNNGTNYGNLSAACYGNSTLVPYGSTINWTANATGGNGSYTYVWSSTDGLYGYTQNVSQTYSTAGLKYATLTVSSGGQTISVYCTANTYGNGVSYNNQSDLGLVLETVGTVNNYGQFVQTGQVLKRTNCRCKNICSKQWII